MIRRYQECDGGSKHERMSALLRISSPDSTSDETGDAFAGTRRGAHETRDTFAGGKRPEIGSFVRAEVSAVSNVCDKEVAVVSVVSSRGSDPPALVPSVSGEAVGGCCESAPEKSHVIRLGEVSIKSENVAIPTIIFQNLKGMWGNYVRNCVWVQE